MSLDEVARLPESTATMRDHRQERDETRGVCVPNQRGLRDAQAPVPQESMPALEPQGLFVLGKSLSWLRARGARAVGTGVTTHNLP